MKVSPLGIILAALGATWQVSAQELTVVSWGGAFAKSQEMAYLRPFEEATGTGIRLLKYDGGIEEIRRQGLEAETRARDYIRTTPLEPSTWLSRLGACDVYLKLENLQTTGSFKLRGAANRLLTLTSEERANGVVTASTGNHGSAVAYLLRALGWPGTVYVPKTISAAKLGALERLEAYANQIPAPVDPNQASAYIVNPLKAQARGGGGLGGLTKMFSTHPPTEARVARLRSLNL